MSDLPPMLQLARDLEHDATHLHRLIRQPHKSAEAAGAAFGEVVELIDALDRNVHELRRTIATDLRGAGESWERIGAFLGYSAEEAERFYS